MIYDIIYIIYILYIIFYIAYFKWSYKKRLGFGPNNTKAKMVKQSKGKVNTKITTYKEFFFLNVYLLKRCTNKAVMVSSDAILHFHYST